MALSLIAVSPCALGWPSVLRRPPRIAPPPLRSYHFAQHAPPLAGTPEWSPPLWRLLEVDANRLADELECGDELECQIECLGRYTRSRMLLVHWAAGRGLLDIWQRHVAALCEMLSLPVLALLPMYSNGVPADLLYFSRSSPPIVYPHFHDALKPLRPELLQAAALGLRTSPLVIIVLALRLLAFLAIRAVPWALARERARRMLPRILDDAAVALESARGAAMRRA